MRIRILLLMFVITSATVFSQQFTSKKFYRQYNHTDGITSISLPGILMKMAAWIAPLDIEEKDLLKSISHLRVLAVEDESMNREVNFYEDFSRFNLGKKYEELLLVREREQDVRIIVREKMGLIRELIIIVGGDENAFVAIKGKISMDDVAQLASEHGSLSMF